MTTVESAGDRQTLALLLYRVRPLVGIANMKQARTWYGNVPERHAIYHIGEQHSSTPARQATTRPHNSRAEASGEWILTTIIGTTVQRPIKNYSFHMRQWQ